MEFQHDLVDRLASQTPGGYFAAGEAASEPTALAGLALLAGGRTRGAKLAADWLVDEQADAGSVGVSPSQLSPCWPTSLALLLWQAIQAADQSDQYAGPIDRALDWAIHDAGRTHAQRSWVGHDTTLIGWSWAANTHSWLEPTAMFVLALKAVGEAEHPRTREAVTLLVDRLLPAGGCNYGNTTVLGQTLLPHVQPTGLVMMALADEPLDDPRIALSLAYLERELSPETTTASLCYGLLGLAANERSPGERPAWLQAAYERDFQRGASTYKLALIALAAAEDYPLRTL
jgi:hypothetical protein